MRVYTGVDCEILRHCVAVRGTICALSSRRLYVEAEEKAKKPFKEKKTYSLPRRGTNESKSVAVV